MAIESPLRRAVTNFSVLMSGRAVAGILSIVTVTLVARILGPVEFGVLVLVHTTAMVTRGLLNFKPSDTVVRFGVAAFDARDHGIFARLLRFTLALDAITAVTSALAMLLLVTFAAPLLGLPEALSGPAALYALALLVSGTGTAKGVLRVAGRFDAISVQQTVGPLLRLLGIGLAYLSDVGLVAYVFVWVMASAGEYAFLNVRGWRELRAQGYAMQMPSWRRAAGEFAGIWVFVRTLYWQSNLELLQRNGLILLAGAMLGPAGAGMFRIAREFADVLAKPVVVVRQAVFPDLERLWREGDRNFRGLYLRLGALSAVIAAVVVGAVAIFGERLLGALVGVAYIDGAALLTWLMLAAAIDLAAAALRPAAYAIGAATGSLRAQALGAGVNVGLFLLLVPTVGLTGAGAAAAGAALTVALLMAWLLATGTPAAGSRTR